MAKPRMLPFVALAFLATPPLVTAEEIAPRRSGSVVDESLGASYNQLGLQHVLGVRWTRSLFHSPSPLLQDAHLAGGLTHTLTPSYMRAGAWLEMAPLSVFSVRAGIEPGTYFGTFSSLRSYNSYDSCLASGCGSARRPGSGARLSVSPTARLRLGAFAAASTATLEWWWSSAAGPFFYEPSRDTLLRSSGDRLFTVSTVLVRRVPQGGGGELTYGVSHDITEVFAAPAPNRSQRIGVVVARRLASRRLGLPSPTIGLRVGYYLGDPRRKGQLSATLGVSIEHRRVPGP